MLKRYLARITQHPIGLKSGLSLIHKRPYISLFNTLEDEKKFEETNKRLAKQEEKEKEEWKKKEPAIKKTLKELEEAPWAELSPEECKQFCEAVSKVLDDLEKKPKPYPW